MKKTDILYLVIIMLIIYAFFSMFVNSDPIQNNYKTSEIGDSFVESSSYHISIGNVADLPDEIHNENGSYHDLISDDNTVQVNAEPSINARSAAVIDFETGTLLYTKNAFSKRPMASTTKIMTAIVALENCSLDEDVLISKRAAGMGGSVMGIKAGTTVKLNDLLHGMLICSGNDAAVAIAEHIGGSIEGFSEMMNKKAIEIGAFSTSFSNPHGLDTENHYSTAYDLAKIARYALKIPEFDEIVRKREFYFNGRTLRSTNEMLDLYDGADGIKTGYTGLAGRCLVTSATREGMRLISVVLFCDTKNLRTSSSMKILDYSFAEYDRVKLLDKGAIFGSINVKRSRTSQEIELSASSDVLAVLRHDQKDSLFTRVSIPQTVTAPVKKGSIMGTVSVYQGDRIIAETSLIAMDSAEKKELKDYIKQVIIEWTKISG
ncbi:MAG: D-alanyl-D-alanine carboxypeptidase [Clostridiaceae bacterium]|nr:D-alanyl-D-alanine carboxypeptidase [Clostridiaceae bacterium]